MTYKMLDFNTKIMDKELWYICLFFHFQLQKKVQDDPLQRVDEEQKNLSSQIVS